MGASNSSLVAQKTLIALCLLLTARSSDTGANARDATLSGSTMERVRWTDERIDERMAAMDEKFDRLFTETRALRAEMGEGFAEVRAEMRAGFGELRAEMRAGFAEQRGELVALQRQLTFIVAGFAVALIGVLAAAVAQL
jgi:hypothetical protein